MRTFTLATLLASVVCLSLPMAALAQGLPYAEGAAVQVTFVKVRPGFVDEYVASLRGTWVAIHEAAKQEGIVTSYRIFLSQPANPDDWDLMMLVEVPTFDGLRERMAVIEQRVAGSTSALRDVYVTRLETREILGVKRARELLLRGK